MTKQELARKRNWSKYRIEGILNPLKTLQYQDKESLTLQERDFLNKAQLQIDLLLLEWDKNSKELGLKPKIKSDVCIK
jgi:hypothetical protein